LWVGKQGGVEQTATKKKPSIGIVVNRKTEPAAVRRNLWKRRVREIFRGHQMRLHPEAICLVKVRRTRTKPSFFSIEKDLVGLLKKAGAWA
jgi:ribonuclease P protein component